MADHETGDLPSDYFPRDGESIEERVARWGARDIQIGNLAETRAVDYLIQQNHRLKTEWKRPWRPARYIVFHHLGRLRLRVLGWRPGLREN